MALMSRRLYEMVKSTQPEKSENAMLIGLQSENQKLKGMIARLYTTYTEEKQKLVSQVFPICIVLGLLCSWTN